MKTRPTESGTYILITV